jgi:glycosyltransferase involved in cell wall biosynthesis
VARAVSERDVHAHASPSDPARDHAAGGDPQITVLDVRIVSGTGGGPDKTILNSPRHLEHTRYRNVAAYIHAPGDPGFASIAARAEERRCPLIAIPDPHPFDVRTLAKLADVCRSLDVRIWHGHDYKSNLFGVLLERLCDLRLVTTVHGWVKHTHKTPLYFAIDRFALRRHREVIAVSRDLYDASLAAGVRRDRLTLIENAIDTDEFRRSAPANDSPLRQMSPGRLVGGAPGRLVVGAVGRLSEEKGFHLLLEAVEHVLDRGLDVELWIAGEGDQRARLEAQIGASRWRERMRLLGFQRDVRALFEALDVFALSSLREGLPNVVLEAMAMEVPVLATRCGGMEAFARDGEDALLVPAGDARALADALERLVRDAELRQRLSLAARAKIEREHGFAQRMQRVRSIYDRIVG